MSGLVKTVEDYMKSLVQVEGGHDFGHFDRVRNWAKKIAVSEGYDNLDMVEVTALMHDIGLLQANHRSQHGKVGGELTLKYLTENNFFTLTQRELIVEAISLHNTIEKNPDNALVAILRDADILDLLGAVGIMRTFIAHHDEVAYLDYNIKGDSWQKNNEYFTTLINARKPISETIIDRLNFNLSCVENLQTKVGKKYAKQQAEYLRNFIIQLENEILAK